MNLRDAIVTSSEIEDHFVLFARRIDGRFSPLSEAVLLELSDDGLDMKTDEVAKNRCPGFSYCIEMFLLREFMQGLEQLSGMNMEQKIERAIYYIEYDA